MAENRDYSKESAWEKKVYKFFLYKCRRDNGDVDRLEKSMNGRSFGQWVRDKLAEEEANKGE